MATPDGYEQTWNAEVCCGKSMADGHDDLGFVRDIVSAVEDDYCVDRSRIYAAGYSNGGIFSIFLACRADDLIAAAASVEAASLDASRCQPSRPVPVFFLNGTGDPVVPTRSRRGRSRSGGRSTPAAMRPRSPSIRAIPAASSGASAARGPRSASHHPRGGHTWPGRRLSALPGQEVRRPSRQRGEIWKFFSAHALPRALRRSPRSPRRAAWPDRGALDRRRLAGGGYAMDFDLVIRGGTIVDGTGAAAAAATSESATASRRPRRRAGKRGRRCSRPTADVVAPGFVDIHTHYDAQVFWDRMLTISPWHGVTSVVMGNCGFGVAPTRAGRTAT